MNRILMKSKTIVAMLVLSVLAVSVVSPMVQAAGSFKKTGSRVSSSYGYRSYTKVTGYESNGSPLNLGAGAEIDGSLTVKFGQGSVSVFSKYSGKKLNAYHLYGRGNSIYSSSRWMEN